jgi:four helix bundle protein
LQRFTELKVWQRSQGLVLDIYRVTKNFPADERYGITSQLRQDYARFLNVAEGRSSKPNI